MDPSSVTKLRLRGKAKGLDHDRARQHLRRQGRETEQTGVRNRKLAPGAKTAGIVSKAVQQSSEVVVIYVILDQ